MDMTGAGCLVGLNDVAPSFAVGVPEFSPGKKKRARLRAAAPQELEGASMAALVEEANAHLARWAQLGVDLESGSEGMEVYLRAQEQRLGPLSTEALQAVLNKARQVRQILLALPAGELPGAGRVASGRVGG
ncbi:MAG: hypothetical protein H7836_03810 [Magnetococcus sp. YQC-3]